MMNSTAAVGVGLDSVAYAGWNTNGNTVGTVVANSILLNMFGGNIGRNLYWSGDRSFPVFHTPTHQASSGQRANAMFNSLRIIEDVYYQSLHRQDLVTYAGQVVHSQGECASNLTADISFYERYVQKLLSARYEEDIKPAFLLPYDWTLNTTFFPWNRTFEIGLCLSSSSSQYPDPSCSM